MKFLKMKKFMTLFVVSMALVATSVSVFANNDSARQVQNTSDISYSGNVTMDTKFDTLIQKLRDFKSKNPKATEKELNNFAKSLVKPQQTASTGIVLAASTDMDGYITGKLNSQELLLYNSDYFKALLCMANGKLALGYAESNYNSGVLHNGNGDAFRHCLWNFGMAIDVGQTFAKKWSDAHENGTTNNPALEKQMDLYNNSIGLKLAKDNPWTFLHSTFISLSKEKCRNGALKIISNKKLVTSTNFGEK